MIGPHPCGELWVNGRELAIPCATFKTSEQTAAVDRLDAAVSPAGIGSHVQLEFGDAVVVFDANCRYHFQTG
jgi:hypothetical protein